jgi:hypothetical protein
MGDRVTRWQGRIPLFVGVTGHHDLHPEEVPAITQHLRTFFGELRTALPSTPIVVLSTLAEGTDQLVVSIAIAAGCESACVLPLERAAYRAGFSTDTARTEFDHLLAVSVIQELPDAGGDKESVDRGYAHAGHYIGRHATILLTLWDGGRSGSTQSQSANDAIQACGWSYAEEFNAAALAVHHRIADSGVAPPFGVIADPCFADVAAVLSTARVLAADSQRAVRRRELWLQIIGFLAAISFAVIFKTSGARWLLWIYLALLAAALVLRTRMRRQAMHRRYLDFRCLTEGLRVVLFWRLAGVHSDPGVHTVTVRVINRQDASLMWIASALSGLAGWIGRVQLPPAFDGCEFAARHWLGSEGDDEQGAQIPYYRRAASRRRRIAARLDRISRVALICGVATAAALAILPAHWVGRAAPVLLAFMGLLPLVSSTSGAIADLPAELGIARQYEGMADLLERAGQRMKASGSDVDRRQVLFEVGTAALAEHSFWHTEFR